MADVRLIDANALKKAFATDMRIVLFDGTRQGAGGFLVQRYQVVGLIDEAPTIDAVPEVHGRWEWYEDWGPSTWLEPPDLDKAGWKCSNCGIDLGDYLTDCLGVNVYVDEEDKMPKIKSCPRCGAKMDGGAGDG